MNNTYHHPDNRYVGSQGEITLSGVTSKTSSSDFLAAEIESDSALKHAIGVAIAEWTGQNAAAGQCHKVIVLPSTPRRLASSKPYDYVELFSDTGRDKKRRRLSTDMKLEIHWQVFYLENGDCSS